MANRYVINPGDKARANRAIKEIKLRFREGQPFAVEFEKPKTPHTSEQAGYYWASLNKYGRHLGYNAKESEEILHREVKCRLFGVEKTIRRHGMILQVPKGSSKRLSKEAYSEMIEELLVMAAEDGYVIEPPPKEQQHDSHTSGRSRIERERSRYLESLGEETPAVNDPAQHGDAPVVAHTR